MKSPFTTTSTSTSKLLSRKLQMNQANSPKYIQNKIYISTRQLSNNIVQMKNSSMKKVIDNKLDLIKQQISREINQHYHKQSAVGNSKSNLKRVDSGRQINSQKKPTRSRAKSQKNSVCSVSASTSRMKPYSRLLQKSTINQSEQYINIKPRRLFQPSMKQTENQTRILSQSISKINLPSSLVGINSNNNNNNNNNNNSSSKLDYKQKYLGLNEKYLEINERYQEEKALVVQSRRELGRVKNTVQNFFAQPHEQTLSKLLDSLTDIKQENNSSYHNSPHFHNSPHSLQQNTNYMLACYQDIQEFKSQLQQLLTLTSTSSLQQLKSLLSCKFSNKKPLPQSIDQFTYKFLELQSSNNRLKEHYQQILKDVQENQQLEIYQLKQSLEKEKQSLDKERQSLEKEKHKNNKIILKLERELKQKEKENENNYLKLIANLRRIITVYANDGSNIISKRNQVKDLNKVNNDKHFVKKMQQLSEFNIDGNDSLDEVSQQHLDFTPKYNLKNDDSNDMLLVQSTPYPSYQNSAQNSHQLSNHPQQLQQLESILFSLTQQLSSIKYEAQQNIQKLRQSNEAISLLDSKLEEIRYQMEEQIREEERKVEENERIIEELELRVQAVNEEREMKCREVEEVMERLEVREEEIVQVNKEVDRLNRQIEQLKKEIFISNKKTIELFSCNASIDDQKKQVQLLIRTQLQSIIKRLQHIDSSSKGLSTREQISTQNTTLSQFDLIPSLPSIIDSHFNSLAMLIQKISSRSQQHHKLYIQKQRQSFQLTQRVKAYQKSILQLQTQLNHTILQKQQYQFLLGQLRTQFQLYKKQKNQEIIDMQRKKDYQLLAANRTILEENAKLNSQIIQLKEQTTRINRQLEEKVNQRTFYRRKAGQTETFMQQKDSRILQLEKQCNQYKLYLEEIEHSFQDIVKNQEISSQKIINLETQKITIIEQIEQLQLNNKSLEGDNNRLSQEVNRITMEAQKMHRKIKQLIEVKEGYQKVNIELRMGNLQMKEKVDQLEEEIKHFSFQLSKQRKLVEKLQRENNQNLNKHHQLLEKLQLSDQKNQQTTKKLQDQKRNYQDAWKLVQQKEEIIQGLMKEIEKFQKIAQNIQTRKTNNSKEETSKKEDDIKRLKKIEEKYNQLDERTKQLRQNEQKMVSEMEKHLKKEQMLQSMQQQIIERQNQLRQNQQQLRVRQQKVIKEEKQLSQKLESILNLKQKYQNQNPILSVQQQQKCQEYIVLKEKQVKLKEQLQKAQKQIELGKQNLEAAYKQIELVHKDLEAIRKELDIVVKQLQSKKQQQQIILKGSVIEVPQILGEQNEEESNLFEKMVGEQLSMGQIRSEQKEQVRVRNQQKQQVNNQQQVISQEMNPHDMALLCSENKLVSMCSVGLALKSHQQCVQQMNLILYSLLSQYQVQSKLSQIPYFDSIKMTYNKVMARILRQPSPLQLDLSQIDFKNSISSSSQLGNNNLAFGLRFNSSQNQPQEKQWPISGKDYIGMEVISRSNTAGGELENDVSVFTYKLKCDHLSEVKMMLYNKVEEMEKENQQLRMKLTTAQDSEHLKEEIAQLQSKLYTYEDFANDELKVGVLWNLFKQIISAYNQDDLQKFQRVCRILFKMLNYPSKEIEEFNIHWENRKKKNKLSSLFTRWTRDGSQEKRQQTAKKIIEKKNNTPNNSQTKNTQR